MVGLDWLFLDGEHSPLEPAEIRTILHAVGGRSPCLYRIPAHDEIPIKKALDLGVSGIIAPQVNSAEQAKQIVDWCRYPPIGSRGTGLARAHGYGGSFREYVESANDEILVVIQVEHVDAVENIDSMVAIPGIDCIYIGPYDLSASLGKAGQVTDPEVVAAIEKVEQVCKSANMPLGIFGVTAESMHPYMDRGYQLITAGIDADLFRRAAVGLKKDLER